VLSGGEALAYSGKLLEDVLLLGKGAERSDDVLGYKSFALILADHPDGVLFDLTIGVAQLLEVVLADIHSVNKHIVDHVQKQLSLFDEVEVPLLPLIGEGKLDEVLLMLRILPYHSVYLLYG